jgi:uncharacterized protein (TIGR00730 family)
MRAYDTGDRELDEAVSALVDRAAPQSGSRNADLVRELIVTSLKMLRSDADRGDVKLMNNTLKELRYSFLIFRRYREVPKVTMYGSARLEAHDPNYELAAEFARRMVDQHGWMVVTGAGPGIMEAGNRGAGSDYSFGVNVRLPFEAGANLWVHESRLINYKYFFTRKLTFVKESDAFVLFPGGFGTLDEAFELLTLIQTGKSDLHPVVLLAAPGTGYWVPWLHLVHRDQRPRRGNRRDPVVLHGVPLAAVCGRRPHSAAQRRTERYPGRRTQRSIHRHHPDRSNQENRCDARRNRNG